MRAQSVRVVSAALTVAICSFLAILLPVPRVLAQGCASVLLTNGLPWYTDADGSIPNATGWQFTQLDGEFDGVSIEYWTGSSWAAGGLLPFTPSYYPSTFALIRLTSNVGDLNIEFCPPVATPTPTLTPTLTPTPTEVVVVTVTPSPTVTPTPVDIGAQLVAISAINYNMFLWSIFIGVITGGLLALGFMRLRL